MLVRERVLIYGDPSTGKSRLATSLPEHHFGRMLYIGADPGSAGLRSVLKKYRERITAVDPHTLMDPYDAQMVAYKLAFGGELQKMAEEAGAQTIIWDTISKTAKEVLKAVADSGQFSDKHVRIGKRGEPGSFNMPMEGDYGATQNFCFNLRDELFKLPYHLIVVAHATYDDPEGGSPAFGPALVGKKATRHFGEDFFLRVHTEKRMSAATPDKPAREIVTAWTARHGNWLADFKHGEEENPIPKVLCEADPINFWNKYLEVVE